MVASGGLTRFLSSPPQQQDSHDLIEELLSLCREEAGDDLYRPRYGCI